MALKIKGRKGKRCSEVEGRELNRKWDAEYSQVNLDHHSCEPKTECEFFTTSVLLCRAFLVPNVPLFSSSAFLLKNVSFFSQNLIKIEISNSCTYLFNFVHKSNSVEEMASSNFVIGALPGRKLIHCLHKERPIHTWKFPH